MTLQLDDSELANNPNTRVPICIALDVSGSIRAAYDTDTTSYFGRAAIG
jgi:hypothetical protein